MNTCAYIAAKPVRFDRNYAVGEVIPDALIDPKMAKRLVDWGKIQRVQTPETSISDAPGPAEPDGGTKKTSRKTAVPRQE